MTKHTVFTIVIFFIYEMSSIVNMSNCYLVDVRRCSTASPLSFCNSSNQISSNETILSKQFSKKLYFLHLFLKHNTNKCINLNYSEKFRTNSVFNCTDLPFPELPDNICRSWLAWPITMHSYGYTEHPNYITLREFLPKVYEMLNKGETFHTFSFMFFNGLPADIK